MNEESGCEVSAVPWYLLVPVPTGTGINMYWYLIQM
jgi:hypothetical protein